MGETPVLPPGLEPDPNPKELLKYEPSTVMLFNLESCPAKDCPLDCGDNRVKSLILLEIVGSLFKALLSIEVLAPVRSLENKLLVAVTSTSESSWPSSFKETLTLENVPKERINPSISCVANPIKDTETR